MISENPYSLCYCSLGKSLYVSNTKETTQMLLFIIIFSLKIKWAIILPFPNILQYVNKMIHIKPILALYYHRFFFFFASLRPLWQDFNVTLLNSKDSF